MGGERTQLSLDVHFDIPWDYCCSEALELCSLQLRFSWHERILTVHSLLTLKFIAKFISLSCLSCSALL